ncbi:MAG: hydroxymethylglutaryl-CoA reductase, degradative [Myxococcota bacterium]|nr:hydroxymethylglutaryl-CoA reductase, degradative [Myxococcota bacterium]
MKSRGASRLKGFYRMGLDARRSEIEKRLAPSTHARPFLGSAPPELIDTMVENAVGAFEMPLGIAVNFLVNGSDVLVPMAIEEPSVIAAASNAAKMARAGSGFQATSDPPLTVGQIEILNPQQTGAARIETAREEILALANTTQEALVALGGGARDLIVREHVGASDRLVVHLVVDCVDAMGANVVNTMAEAVSDRLATLSGGRIGLRIVTNLADQRLARATCAIPLHALARRGFKGSEVAKGIERAYAFAAADPYRAATHNKGIFNGIDAVLTATGNDWRAVEAGGHAYAARSGRYSPLSTWHIQDDGLFGTIALPLAVGIVGGASRSHPTARACLDLMGVETAAELACVVAATGLATNLAALAALSSEGIQQGHMRLHKRKPDLPTESP